MIKKKYKNEIFQNLLNHPLGIDNFSLEDKGKNFVVIYEPYNSVFKFSFGQTETSLDRFNCHAVLFRPKLESEWLDNGAALSFQRALVLLNSWLEYDVTEYINDQNEPDLWEEYQKNSYGKNLKELNYRDHTNFTNTEKSQILMGINELKLLMLNNFASTATEKEIIATRLNYLTEATGRLENKSDWKGIFINTFITICIALSLDTQRGQELYQLFLNVLNIVPVLPNL